MTATGRSDDLNTNTVDLCRKKNHMQTLAIIRKDDMLVQQI